MDELAARRATRQHATVVTNLDHIADTIGHLIAHIDHLGAGIEHLIHRGTPIQPSELQDLIAGDND